METETSSFETTEVLANFITSTDALTETWRRCSLANTTAPHGFVTDQIGDVGYVAFSGIQMVSGSDPNCRSLVELNSYSDGLFSPLDRHGEPGQPAMVHAGFLQLFLSMYNNQCFQNQVLQIMARSKSIIVTGHSIGGTLASLSALWLLSHYLEAPSSDSLNVLCITFGSPLLGNESLSGAILRQQWSGNFVHIVTNHDIVPRLLFAPLNSYTPHLQHLLQYWHSSMHSENLDYEAHGPHGTHVTLPQEAKNELFRFVGAHTEAPVIGKTTFCPFGNYFFCSRKGAICLENVKGIVKMLHLLFITGDCSVEDHLRYGDYVRKVCSEYPVRGSFLQREANESCYDVGIGMALQACGVALENPIAGPVKECLTTARRMGRTPSLKCSSLAIDLSLVSPRRAELEWYKATCDASDDQLGYYDTYKRIEASKRDGRVTMNRIKLGMFWDKVIKMMYNNELPHDFHMRGKWVYASQFYKLLVEPLDIAHYYRSGEYRKKGHYMKGGRARHYEVFDRWWKLRPWADGEDNKKRSKFASLTQDSCFWARVEEARMSLDEALKERDPRKMAQLWEDIEGFERYAQAMVERKEVSQDVLAKNSSYSLWLKGYGELRTYLNHSPTRFPGLLGGEVS